MGDGTVTCDQHFITPKNYTVRDSGLHMTTIDSVLATLNRPILMVKMDVGGYEGHVFQGAVKTIIQACVPFIVFEFSYAWVKQSGGHADMLIESLSEAGDQFSFDYFQSAPFDPMVYFADPQVEQADLASIFCVHEDVLLPYSCTRLGLGTECIDCRPPRLRGQIAVPIGCTIEQPLCSGSDLTHAQTVSAQYR